MTGAGAAALLIGAAVLYVETSTSNAVEVRYVSWFDENNNYLGDSAGALLRAGGSFTTALSLTCPQWPLSCNVTEALSFLRISGLGQTGWVHEGIRVTSSNLPLLLPAGGRATVELTVQMPDQKFLGYLVVSLTVST